MLMRLVVFIIKLTFEQSTTSWLGFFLNMQCGCIKMYDNKKLVLEKHLRNNVSAFQSINNKKERIRRDAMQ